MDERQLMYLIRQDLKLKKCFLGIFASDELAHLDISSHGRPCAIICNTDKRNQPGTHWLALFITDNSSLDFFCSYGTAPPKFVMDFAKKNLCGPYRFSSYALQSPLSNTCGYWVFAWLRARAHGHDMSHFSSQFSHYAWIANEDKLMKIV